MMLAVVTRPNTGVGQALGALEDPGPGVYRGDICLVCPRPLEFRSARHVSRLSRLDAHAGLLPFYMVGTIGTTSSCAVDPIGEMGAIAQKYKIW